MNKQLRLIILRQTALIRLVRPDEELRWHLHQIHRGSHCRGVGGSEVSGTEVVVEEILMVVWSRRVEGDTAWYGGEVDAAAAVAWSLMMSRGQS